MSAGSGGSRPPEWAGATLTPATLPSEADPPSGHLTDPPRLPAPALCSAVAIEAMGVDIKAVADAAGMTVKGLTHVSLTRGGRAAAPPLPPFVRDGAPDRSRAACPSCSSCSTSALSAQAAS